MGAIDEILPLREKGLSIVEIAKLLNKTHQAISACLRHNGYIGHLMKVHVYECINCHKVFNSRYSNSKKTEQYKRLNRFCTLKCQTEYHTPEPIYKGVAKIENKYSKKYIKKSRQ